MSFNLLDRLLSGLSGYAFAIRLWDGTVKRYGTGEPKFTVVIKKKEVLGELAGNLSIGFGEAYMRGDIEVEGSLFDLFEMFHATTLSSTALSLPARIAVWAMHLRQRNVLGQAARNVQHHYDLGNDFYALWLGKERVYSCAYFKTPDDSIDTAQEQKLEHIAKKLFLKRGETLLDIGCGWGALVIHAAKKYGVRAHGITLSKEQFAYATERVKAEGLTDQVKIELCDYRELIRRGLRFDTVASVGMFEHVGKEHMSAYFAATDRLLKPGGIGFLHTIGHMRGNQIDPWIKKYIFPGAYLPGLAEIVSGMTQFPFRIIDVENLRLHYALTLERWLAGVDAHVDKIRAMYGETFVRMWRFYLAGSSTGFRYGDLDLWQIQFTKGLRNDLPLTRDYLSS